MHTRFRIFVVLLVFVAAVAARAQDVLYRAQVAVLGWSSWASDGEQTGTIGQNRRMEAVQIALGSLGAGDGIQYRAHTSGIGWMGWVSNGAIAGTVGQSRAMEAIQIMLVNPRAGYSVRYRAHVAGIGWQSWVRDGAVAGTTGQSRQMEALEVVIDRPAGAPTRYYIVSVNTDKVLSVASPTVEGAAVEQAELARTQAQKWTLVSAGNGYVNIENEASGKVLDLASVPGTWGTKVVLKTPGVSTTQLWSLVDIGANLKEIVNVSTALALDVEMGSKADHAKLTIWGYHESTNEQWRLVSADAPTPASIDMRSLFPAPKDQGVTASCVGWAVSYARSYQLAKKWGWSDVSNPAKQQSPAFVYNSIPHGEGGRSNVGDAFNLISNYGCDTWADMPYNDGDLVSPTAEQWANASRFRTNTFGWYEISGGDWVRKIKWAVQNGNPVVVGFNARVPDKDNPVGTKTVWHNPTFWNPIGYATIEPYIRYIWVPHVVCVIGYDDNSSSFLCIDSLTIDYKYLGIDFTGWPVDGIPNDDVHARVRALSYAETLNCAYVLTEGQSSQDRKPSL